MYKDYIKLHIAILLAGFTGVFGKLIHLDQFVLVWYRLLMVTAILLVVMLATRKLKKLPFKSFLKVFLIGTLIAFHWVAFYASIMNSNISVGVVCLSLSGFFTAICEPIILKKKLFVRELLLGVISIVGIMLIFTFDTKYRLGITFGIITALLGSLFTIFTKKWENVCSSSNMLFYEMLSGFMVLMVLTPFYLMIFPNVTFAATTLDIVWLVVLAGACTVIPFLYQIECLKTISAFTLTLSYNLEPIYSILIAFIFFGEAKELNFSFYIGLFLIIASVALQSALSIPKKH